MDTILQAHKLAKTYRIGFWRRKVQALRDATFDVRPKEVFGLIGPNGAGKTTTLKILTGLVSPDHGHGSLLGHPIGTVHARQNLGYLPESPYFYEYLNVEELLDFYGSLFGIPSQKRAKKIDEMIEKVGLSHARNRPLRKFSKGMLQRAGLAQALIHDPSLVILDEPQTGLDPIGRAQVTDLILESKAQGRSVFFSSHILSDVERVCDRVAVMVQGKVVGVGTLGELLEKKVLGVEIILDGLDPTHQAEFESLGAQWRVLQDASSGVLLATDTPESAQRIVQRALQLGASIRSYDERHEHLEDLFLRQAAANPPPPQDD